MAPRTTNLASARPFCTNSLKRTLHKDISVRSVAIVEDVEDTFSLVYWNHGGRSSSRNHETHECFEAYFHSFEKGPITGSL
jgi:hypothetical protein